MKMSQMALMICVPLWLFVDTPVILNDDRLVSVQCVSKNKTKTNKTDHQLLLAFNQLLSKYLMLIKFHGFLAKTAKLRKNRQTAKFNQLEI